MIFVNARAIIMNRINNDIKILIQKRTKENEICYELPGGRIEEFESITDALRREVKEETGLDISYIEDDEKSFISNGTFKTQCVSPFCAYQTIEGPVDSFGLHFVCESKGVSLNSGDDTAEIHWATVAEIIELIDTDSFSSVDKPALIKFFRERLK